MVRRRAQSGVEGAAGVLAANSLERSVAVDTIRREQVELLRVLELLHARCARMPNPVVAVELSALRRRLRDHVGLVSAVLDAAVEDDLTPDL